jgi:hypothetical protein
MEILDDYHIYRGFAILYLYILTELSFFEKYANQIESKVFSYQIRKNKIY